MITYCRIEAKLIHGQTTTVLRNSHKCDCIILVDDPVSTDSGMKTIFAAAAPRGVKVYFFGTEKALNQLPKAEKSSYAYFVIFRGPLDVKRMVDAGYEFTYPVVVGQQFNRDNTVPVMQGVGLTREEIEALDYVTEKGCEVILDPSCTGENVPWSQVRSQLEGKLPL